jgi:AraC-like DNA-binding protein
MAGSPKKKALRIELERRTREEWPDELERTHLDYVADWQANGKTLRSLCDQLAVSPNMLHTHLRDTYGVGTVRDVLARAREAGAHLFAEESIDIADAATEDDVQVARLQVSTRQWVAERWNPKELGGQKGANLIVNVGSLMLEALRQPAPSAIPSAIVEDAEVLSIEEVSTCEAEQRTTNPTTAAAGLG